MKKKLLCALCITVVLTAIDEQLFFALNDTTNNPNSLTVLLKAVQEIDALYIIKILLSNKNYSKALSFIEEAIFSLEKESFHELFKNIIAQKIDDAWRNRFICALAKHIKNPEEHKYLFLYVLHQKNIDLLRNYCVSEEVKSFLQEEMRQDFLDIFPLNKEQYDLLKKNNIGKRFIRMHQEG